MNKKLKRIVSNMVPLVLLAPAAVQADEIQSVAAQAIAQAAKPPAPPQTPIPDPPEERLIIRGRRM